ncbi:MAG: ribbon-helix-helix protein, CopG family [Acidilobaceae archaeon]
MRVVSFKADEDLLFLLEEYSKKKNMSKSEIIRRALKLYISRDISEPVVTKKLKVLQ